MVVLLLGKDGMGGRMWKEDAACAEEMLEGAMCKGQLLELLAASPPIPVDPDLHENLLEVDQVWGNAMPQED